jgi:hypothetical protein
MLLFDKVPEVSMVIQEKPPLHDQLEFFYKTS